MITYVSKENNLGPGDKIRYIGSEFWVYPALASLKMEFRCSRCLRGGASVSLTAG